ncbi:MAG: hypothetical protein OXI15_21135 [Chromatiales bacterium]|nr:hypothetical protein [Chromatiales bacterium]
MAMIETARAVLRRATGNGSAEGLTNAAGGSDMYNRRIAGSPDRRIAGSPDRSGMSAPGWRRRSRRSGSPPESSSPDGSASFAARAAAGVLRLRRVLAAALLCVPLLPAQAQAQTQRTLVHKNINTTNCASSNCVTAPNTVTWHDKWGGVYQLRYTWDFSDGPSSAWAGILTLERPYRMRYYQTTNTSSCPEAGGQSGASNNSTFSGHSGTSGVYARPGHSYCMVFGTVTGDYRVPGGIALAWIGFITPAAP